MRMNRTVAALVGLALLGVTPVALASSASAAEAERVAPADTAAVARALPKPDIPVKVVEPRRNKLIFKGRVKPDFSDGWVVVQKKNCAKATCKWFKYRTVKSDDIGRFKTQIGAPRNGYWYWRAMVKKSDEYGTSYSDVWRTYTI